jgi:hypothetical protein
MTQASNPVRLLTEGEAAELLSVEPTTLRRWRWSGDGPPFRKIGACVRYHPADLDTYIEAATRRSTSDPGGEADGK